MHDSSSGIRPSPNMEQGSTYKKTFIGEPPLLGAGAGSGNQSMVTWDSAMFDLLC